VHKGVYCCNGLSSFLPKMDLVTSAFDPKIGTGGFDRLTNAARVELKYRPERGAAAK
jgi:hypothetical protein